MTAILYFDITLLLDIIIMHVEEICADLKVIVVCVIHYAGK